MPDIQAFRAWRYNPAKAKDLAAVFAPPYDVISRSQQEALYRASPRNVIRLELGKEITGDSDGTNKYTRAAQTLNDWKSSQALIREKSPAIYVCMQDYREDGKKRTRLGFFAAMKADEKAVLKHENTLKGPKEDRLALLKAVRTNLSPIWGLFEDKKGSVQTALKKALAGKPIVDVTIDAVRHRLYVETRPDVIASIEKAMKPKPMFIADGHHRFEVACQFKDWMSAKAEEAASGKGWDRVMTYFSDCVHNPFKIFPTHRLLKLGSDIDALRAVRGLGELDRIGSLAAVLKRLEKNRSETKDKKYSFGLYSKKNGFYIFTLNKKCSSRVKQNPVDKLDVSVLHRFLIEPCYHIRSIEKSEAIDFTRDPREAVQKVNQGEFDLVLFLRPTSLEEMLAASKKGLKMPQKSTYFYPKLLTGLVFYSFEDAGS